MTAVGKAWRIIGLLLASTLYVVGLIDGRFWVLAGFGFGGLLIFLVSWLVAASFDVKGRAMRCRLDGCDAPATSLVIGPHGLLEVCRDCRNWVVEMWGYMDKLDVR